VITFFFANAPCGDAGVLSFVQAKEHGLDRDPLLILARMVFGFGQSSPCKNISMVFTLNLKFLTTTWTFGLSNKDLFLFIYHLVICFSVGCTVKLYPLGSGLPFLPVVHDRKKTVLPFSRPIY